MNTLEDRLTAALRETGEEITTGQRPAAGPGFPAWRRPACPRSCQPAPLAGPADTAGRRRGRGGRGRRLAGHLRRRSTARTQAPGIRGAGRPAARPPDGPAALRKVPPYYVSLTPGNNTYILGGRRAEVRATATGTVLATIRPPRPFGAFTWVSGASDDRTFILAAQRYWTILPGNRGAKAHGTRRHDPDQVLRGEPQRRPPAPRG